LDALVLHGISPAWTLARSESGVASNFGYNPRHRVASANVRRAPYAIGLPLSGKIAMKSTAILAAAAIGLMAQPAFAAPKDCSSAQIPDTPVRGTVNGQPFVPNAVGIHITRGGMQINDAKFDTYELSI